jgi:hypothetical protein
MKNMCNVVSGVGVALLWGALACASTIATNGSFENGTEGWKGEVNTDVAIPKPEFISHVSDKGAADTIGCMKVTFDIPEGEIWNSFKCGAVSICSEMIPAGAKVEISFYAKRLSGSNVLSLFRHGGGGEPEIFELDRRWKKYSVTKSFPHDTQAIVFSLVYDPNKKHDQPLQSGSFLIDEFSVEMVK